MKQACSAKVLHGNPDRPALAAEKRMMVSSTTQLYRASVKTGGAHTRAQADPPRRISLSRFEISIIIALISSIKTYPLCLTKSCSGLIVTTYAPACRLTSAVFLQPPKTYKEPSSMPRYAILPRTIPILLLLLSAVAPTWATDALAIDSGGNTAVNGALILVPLTVPGAPSAGTWNKGALVTDSNAELWQCTAAGTPGTWRHYPVHLQFMAYRHSA
jgi:hypothetical protein